MGPTRRDFLTPGLRLVLLLPVIPTLALIVVFMSADDETGPVAIGVAVVVLLSLIAVEQSMHAFITVRSGSVRVGFFPFFRRTLSFQDIVDVEPVKLDPMRDYGGWGIKGKSRSGSGMLFSGGGSHGLVITTRDDRRYVVTNLEPLDDLAGTLRGLVR